MKTSNNICWTGIKIIIVIEILLYFCTVSYYNNVAISNNIPLCDKIETIHCCSMTGYNSHIRGKCIEINQIAFGVDGKSECHGAYYCKNEKSDNFIKPHGSKRQAVDISARKIIETFDFRAYDRWHTSSYIVKIFRHII